MVCLSCDKMLQLTYMKWRLVAYSSGSWPAEDQGASVWSGCLPCPTAGGFMLPPHTAEVENKLPGVCRGRTNPIPIHRSKTNAFRLQPHSLNHLKEREYNALYINYLWYKKCFSIPHLILTLIQLLAQFVD